ncbi:MAG: rhomboid family intramembrane serine protease [Desulfuromonadia bacterium]
MSRGNGPVICGRCHRIIGAQDSSCPWCGAGRPGFFTSIIRGDMDGEVVVRWILWGNVGYYLLSVLISGSQFPLNPFAFFSPDQQSLFILGATGTVPIDRFGRYETLIAASWLHGGILHLVFNLMALRQIAPWVSREFGPSRMFIIYTGGGVTGFLLSYFAGIPFTIGASASLCGLIGSLLFYGKSRGGFYGAAVYRVVSGWVFGLFLFGLIVPGINNWGHGGGILGGILIARIVGYHERSPESHSHRVIALITAILTASILAWGVFQAFVFEGFL